MNAIIQNIEITERNEARVNFAKSIDFAELCDHAAALANVECGFGQPTVAANHNGELYVNIASDDIAAQTGAFAAVIKECRITSFSSGFGADKEMGEQRLWVQLSLSYSHKDGGSNGMTLLNAWYTERGGWVFRDVK